MNHQQVKAGEDNLIIAKCTHEPIISHELFNAVQEYRKQICEESKATPKRPYTPNIFKGKVFCTDCGRSLHRQRAERRKGPDTYWFHCLTNSRVEKDSCKGAMIQEKELISTVTAILEKELTVALGMSLPLFQLEARQKQEKDKLKIQMSAKRQEIEKTRRLIRGLYENFVQGILTHDEYFELKADYEHAINALSGEIEVFEKSIGELKFRDVVVLDAIPPIVPLELFDDVQEKIAKNKKAPARRKAEDDYLLTTKLYCGYCGALMFGESGTSRTGEVHRYYKCATAKKKKGCKKKTVRKQWLEDLVVNQTMQLVRDDAAMESIIAKVMELQDRENTNLPLYEKQLRDAESGIQNMLNAIQAGILTSSTKERLEQLEETKRELETRIAEEKLAKPKIKEEFIRFNRKGRFGILF